jgi:hypothetical protein
MATTYFGMRGTGDWSDPDLRPLNYRETAFKLFPDSPAPFTYIMSKLASRKTDDPEYKIFEWRLPDMAFTVNGEVAISGTTIAFDAPGSTPTKGLKAGDMLRVESGNANEVVRVIADPVSPYTSITVERYWGGTNTGAVISDNAIMRWVGSAYEEGSRGPTAISRTPSVVTNYTQIFKDAVKVTKTAKFTRTRPMKPWPQLKGECLERMMIKIEYAMLYGVQAETTGPDGEPLRTTAGIESLLTTNAVDFSGGVDLDTFEDSMEDVFKYGSNRKLALCGNRALNILNRMVNRNTQLTYMLEKADMKRTYGLNVTSLISPFGTLDLVPHPLMTESAAHTKDVFIIDTKYVNQVVMAGGDVDWDDNVQLPDEHAQKGQYVGELGLSLALEEVHGYWYGLNAYVA